MIDIKDLSVLGNIKEEENLQFRLFLKTNADEEKLDEQFKKLHEKYFKIYDCSKCRNCCKKINTKMTKEELDEICKRLNLKQEDFIRKYLKESDECYTFKKSRCLFLTNDNNCKVKKSLPLSCKLYPYTNKPDRISSLYSIIDNTHTCPVVYEIMEELKKEYRFKIHN